MQTIEDMTEIIDKRLEELLHRDFSTNKRLFERVSYALSSGGKRLRPRMLLSVSGMKGLDVACALECIHNYSLIHDDLPCMDNDLERRGKPTMHVAYGESDAVLVGDLLLTYSFELLAKLDLAAEMRCQIIAIIAKYSGISGMIGGQFLDILAKNVSLSFEEYQKIALQKTGLLFVAALECGAVIAELAESEKQKYIHFGYIFGLLYQIGDDLKDSDTPSVIDILGKDKSISLFSFLIKHAKHLLQTLKEPNSFLHYCLDILAPL